MADAQAPSARRIAETDAQQATAPAASLREVLIVDDHPLMCDALALTLKMGLGLRNLRRVNLTKTYATILVVCCCFLPLLDPRYTGGFYSLKRICDLSAGDGIFDAHERDWDETGPS